MAIKVREKCLKRFIASIPMRFQLLVLQTWIIDPEERQLLNEHTKYGRDLFCTVCRKACHFSLDEKLLKEGAI